MCFINVYKYEQGNQACRLIFVLFAMKCMLYVCFVTYFIEHALERGEQVSGARDAVRVVALVDPDRAHWTRHGSAAYQCNDQHEHSSRALVKQIQMDC